MMEANALAFLCENEIRTCNFLSPMRLYQQRRWGGDGKTMGLDVVVSDAFGCLGNIKRGLYMYQIEKRSRTLRLGTCRALIISCGTIIRQVFCFCQNMGYDCTLRIKRSATEFCKGEGDVTEETKGVRST
jgi:hypothetical protein